MAAWQGLLKKTNVYRWGEEHEKALVKVKEIITNPIGSVLKHFDLKFPKNANTHFQDRPWVLPCPDGT
jgi:hypothetical protein